MNENRELHKYLLRLVILPVAIVCALVSITFFYLYSQDKHKQSHEHHQLLNSLLKDAFDLHKNDQAQLRHIANAILAMDAHRAILLINKQGHIVAHFGAPTDDISLAIRSDANVVRSSDYIFYRILRNTLVVPEFIPKSNTNNSANSEFILVQTENYYNRLGQHQAILGILLTTALCFFVLLYFARQFNLALSSPLVKMQDSIRALLRGEFNTPIHASDNSIYRQLIDAINGLASSQKIGQENLQESIEQSTLELRETLETVEVQNIELDIARKNAVQANRAKSEFLANTSHEIKTPLSGIVGFAELLSKTRLSQQQLEYIHAIHESAKGLANTINDILDYSRLELGSLTLEHKPVSVREVVEDSIQLLAPSAADKEIRLLTIIDPDVPDNLLGDPLRIRQILSNLISNAIKFTPEGYVLVNVRTELIAEERYTLRFKITDSGIGLSTGQQEILFNAFTQMDMSENRPRNGSGLGLVIAKGLVDRMSGEIGVESQQGKGATFWFTATFSKNLAINDTQPGRLGSLTKVNCLFHEKNTMGRMELGHYMRSWGAKLEEISNFSHILESCENFFSQEKSSLVVLDMDSVTSNVSANEASKLVKTITEKYQATFCLLYRASDKKLFPENTNEDRIVQLNKPVMYQCLHRLLCASMHKNAVPGMLEHDISNQKITTENVQTTIHVLAVDDNPANLKLVCELLKDKAITVKTAENGKQALEYFIESHYDLVLMDMQMPIMDGVEATKKIREIEGKNARTPIVALTAHAASEKKMTLLLAGMDDYIKKPVSSSDLQQVLDRWLKIDIAKERNNESKQNGSSFPETEQKHTVSKSNFPVDIAMSLSKAQNKNDLAKDMLAMLIDSLTESRSLIQTHHEKGDVIQLHEVIHKLHGGCCYCGVPALTSICAKLDNELQSSHKNIKDLETDLTELYNQLDELAGWARVNNIDELFGTKQLS